MNEKKKKELKETIFSTLSLSLSPVLEVNAIDVVVVGRRR